MTLIKFKSCLKQTLIFLYVFRVLYQIIYARILKYRFLSHCKLWQERKKRNKKGFWSDYLSKYYSLNIHKIWRRHLWLWSIFFRPQYNIYMCVCMSKSMKTIASTNGLIISTGLCSFRSIPCSKPTFQTYIQSTYKRCIFVAKPRSVNDIDFMNFDSKYENKSSFTYKTELKIYNTWSTYGVIGRSGNQLVQVRWTNRVRIKPILQSTELNQPFPKSVCRRIRWTTHVNQVIKPLY